MNGQAKDHTLRISKEKKFKKIMLSRVLNPLLQNYILARVVDFLIAGNFGEVFNLANWQFAENRQI